MRRTLIIFVILSLFASACSGSGDGDASSGNPTTTANPVDSDEPSTGCGSEGQPVPGTERLSVEHDRSDPAVEREVERVIPASYDGTTPRPMIVSLHGFTSNIDQIDLFSGLPTAADTRGYVLLTPQALPATVPIGDTTIKAPFWNVLPDLSGNIEGVHDDVGFILELIDDTVSEICIDPDRIYVTGNSNGAGMTAALACAGEGRIAAIAPVSGINLSESCSDVTPVSVIAFHGDADPLVSYEGGSAATADLDAPTVVEAVGSFADAANCDPDPAVSVPFEDIEVRRWSACEPGIDVELYTVLDGGHTWPGMLNYVDPTRLSELGQNQELAELSGVGLGEIAGNMTVSIEATELMLDFFEDHPRSG